MPLIDKIKSWFNSSGRPITAGYNPGPSALVYANWHRRPPWSYFYADIMLLDPQVWFGLNIGNGPLLSAKVKLKPGPKLKSRSDSQEIQEFVMRQWDRIWSTSAPQILRAKHYGFLAYEVICKEVDGRIEFDRLRDFHPLDVGQLKSNGARVGVRIRNIQIGGNGYVDLYGPKGLWITYGDEFSRTWGRAILERCYQPWFDKNSDGGAMDLRRLRNFKDAWIGDQIRYPLKQIKIPSTGQMVSGRDLAREIGENRASGAPIFLPSTRDQLGNYEWDYTPPQGVAGDTKIPEWIGDLDWDILDGLLVPREVVEAGGTGSGFSGRSVPLVGFLAVRDTEFGHDVRQVKQQTVGPLALVNYGDGADDFDLDPVPLLETTGDLMGGMGQPDMQNGDGGGKPPAQQPPGGNGAPPAQPGVQQFSVQHAPHNMTIGGKKFKGGEFIPGKYLAKASAKEKAAIKAGAKKPKGEKAAKAKESAKEKTKPGKLSDIKVKIKKTDERAFLGKPVEVKNKISKQESGAIGEAVILEYVKSLGYPDAGPMNTTRNNFPIDLFFDHATTEIKTGLASNGAGAQQWRLTIGEPGNGEKEWLAKASPEEKAAWNKKKQQAIHKRKEAVLKEVSEETGHVVKPKTITVILNPDTQTADIYEFEGWHDRIGWNSEEAKKAYKGSVKYARAA